MTSTDHPLVRAYLAQLEGALTDLPDDDRRQILDGIEEHVAAALVEVVAPTEADVRQVLSRLGDPETIAADASERLDVEPSTAATSTGRVIAALLWIGAVVGVFDLVMVSTSQVGPVEFAFLAVPVVTLVVIALVVRHHSGAGPATTT